MNGDKSLWRKFWMSNEAASIGVQPDWPHHFSKPTAVLADGEPVKPWALFAGWLGDVVYGWHSWQGQYATKEEAETRSIEWRQAGRWWQIVNVFTGQIVAQGSGSREDRFSD